MVELTPEEKAKIYAEEKARLEAQDKVKAEQKSAQSKSAAIGCFAILVLVAIVYFAGQLKSCSGGGSSSSSSAPSYVDLKASARFTGTQFIITNLDSFDWTNVKLELNEGLLRSGYSATTSILQAGQAYTVGALQFAKPDGTRFNPFALKPQSITISCGTPKGKGFYTGSWK